MEVVGKNDGKGVDAGLCPQHQSALLLNDDHKARGMSQGLAAFIE